MKIRQQGHILTIEDGLTARWVIGLVVPLAVGLGWMILYASASGDIRLDIGALGFFGTFLALAVLRAPRTADIDSLKHEVRLVIGWLPPLQRIRTIPITSVRQAEIWQPLRWINRAQFWPALALHSGELVALSGYPRSRAFSGKVVESVQRFIFETPARS